MKSGTSSIEIETAENEVEDLLLRMADWSKGKFQSKARRRLPSAKFGEKTGKSQADVCGAEEEKGFEDYTTRVSYLRP